MQIFRVFYDFTAFKYALSGIANTVVGYISFLIFHYFFFMNVFFANAASYVTSLAFGFVLNHYFVFKYGEYVHSKLFRFVLAFMIAFVCNQMALWVTYSLFGLIASVSQIIAMICYSVTFYLLNRFYVFYSPIKPGL